MIDFRELSAAGEVLTVTYDDLPEDMRDTIVGSVPRVLAFLSDADRDAACKSWHTGYSKLVPRSWAQLDAGGFRVESFEAGYPSTDDRYATIVRGVVSWLCSEVRAEVERNLIRPTYTAAVRDRKVWRDVKAVGGGHLTVIVTGTGEIMVYGGPILDRESPSFDPLQYLVEECHKTLGSQAETLKARSAALEAPSGD